MCPDPFALDVSALPGDSIFFFFNDTATTEIYTLSLHDALPILLDIIRRDVAAGQVRIDNPTQNLERSEEHTSELQSPDHLVCRLLLEKKKRNAERHPIPRSQTGTQSAPSAAVARVQPPRGRKPA